MNKNFFFCALACAAVLCGSCASTSTPSIPDAVIGRLDDLGASINFQSDQWRQAVQDIVDELTEAGHTAIANDLDGVVTGAIQAAGQTGMCGIDFMRDRMREEIQRFVAMLRGQSPPALPAHICVVDPPTVDLNIAPNALRPVSISGYNLRDRETQASQLQLIAVRGRSGGTFEVSDWLGVSSPYGAAIDLDQPSGCRLIHENVVELRLMQGDQVLSQIPVTMPALIPEGAIGAQGLQLGPFAPPHTAGDANFNSGVFDTVVRVTLKATAEKHGDNKVRAHVEMDAREWNARTDVPDGDKTCARGTSGWVDLYTAPAGRKIKRIVTSMTDAPPTSTYKGWDQKTINGAGGLVRKYTFFVDGAGLDDAGNYTKVSAQFNPVQVELEPLNPWCPQD